MTTFASDPRVRPLVVTTCIGCGARSRVGSCPGGCADVPLDLVEAGDVERLRARIAALETRVTRLRAFVADVGEPPHWGWPGLRRRAHEVLHELPEPPAAPVTVIPAWGCPDCGRVDAPQPCLGVCVGRPVLMEDAAEARELLADAARLEAADAALLAVTRLVALVRPRPGYEARTCAALSARARRALR